MDERKEFLLNPARAAGERQIPPSGMLCLNPGEAARLGQRVLAGGGRKQFLFNSNLYVSKSAQYSSSLFVAGPAVGAPMAVLALEKLIALGCQRLVAWGWCGALVEGLRLGNLLLPTIGISEEGTSGLYELEEEPASHPEWRERLVSQLVAEGWSAKEGKVWSTDAPYRESRQKVRDYAARGAVAVDMEFSALATVAAYRGIDLVGVFIVSDELWRETWRPGFEDREFKMKNQAVGDLLLNWLATSPAG